MYIKVMYYFFFFFVMTTLNIGTFNVNGCRCTRKRAALFDYLRLKQADVILLQERIQISKIKHSGMVIGRAVLY